MDESWHAGFHDPTPVGWITTAAYLVATLLCLRMAWGRTADQHRLTWVGLTLLMAFFTINKQLDFQTWLRFLGRDYTMAHSMYEQKEKIRLVFMSLLLGSTVLLLIIFRRRLLTFLKTQRTIAAGLALLATYIVIRGVNFEKLGPLAPLELLPEFFQWPIEIAGLVLILFSLLRQPRLPAEA